MQNKELFDRLIGMALELGATQANVIEVKDLVFDPVSREICATNACGQYGKCWTCPPDAGAIDDLMAKAKQYSYALVYQTVTELEDSYDYEGMMEAGNIHNGLAREFRQNFPRNSVSRALHLGAGGCRLCKVCAKKTDELCRRPDLALQSLEAYGIHVSKMAEAAGMKYINGQDTVTYFGAVLFML